MAPKQTASSSKKIAHYADYKKIAEQVEYEPVLDFTSELAQVPELQSAITCLKKSGLEDLLTFKPTEIHAMQVGEFLMKLYKDKDGIVRSRISNLVDEVDRDTGKKVTKRISTHIDVKEQLRAVYNLPTTGINPDDFARGEEDKHFKKMILPGESTELKAKTNKCVLKPHYRFIHEVVCKCIAQVGSTEQVSQPKIRLVAAIASGAMVNWEQYFLDRFIGELSKIKKNDKRETAEVAGHFKFGTKVSGILGNLEGVQWDNSAPFNSRCKVILNNRKLLVKKFLEEKKAKVEKQSVRASPSKIRIAEIDLTVQNIKEDDDVQVIMEEPLPCEIWG